MNWMMNHQWKKKQELLMDQMMNYQTEKTEWGVVINVDC